MSIPVKIEKTHDHPERYCVTLDLEPDIIRMPDLPFRAVSKLFGRSRALETRSKGLIKADLHLSMTSKDEPSKEPAPVFDIKYTQPTNDAGRNTA